MSASDYIIDILLLALVLRQIQPRQLTPRSIVLPGAILVFAGEQYLHSSPTAGNDLYLIFLLIAVGLVFGIVSGVTTRVWKDDTNGIMAQAGIVAAAVWILGMGIRFGFDIWAHATSGELKLFHFSIHHSITSADAYSTAFVLMAFAQVIFRIGILQYRRAQLEKPGVPAGQPA